MKVKLDENLDTRLAGLLEVAGHDTATVTGQRLTGMDDEALFLRCREEGRVLVTLDLVFANMLRYVVSESPGGVVLRGPNQHFATMRMLMETLSRALNAESPEGHLWIVEPGRLRVHEGGEMS